MIEGTDEHGEVSGGESVLNDEGRNPSPLRWLCEGRNNTGLTHTWEAPNSVRDLSINQYPPRVDGKYYGGWLKAWTDTKKTVEVEMNPKYA